MKSRKLRYDMIPLFLLVIFFTFSFFCQVDKKKERKRIYEEPISSREREGSFYRLIDYVTNEDKPVTDFEKIRKRGKLIALTSFGPTNYFVYKGTPMGFEHDLLKLLAKDLGVGLEIVVVHNMDELVEKLNKGEGDIIAGKEHGMFRTYTLAPQ